MAEAFLLAATAMAAVGSIKGGIDARNDAKKEAGMLEEETRIQAREKTKDLNKLLAAQRMGYAKSGVTLEGSPLLVIDQTRSEGLQEINDLIHSGFTKADVIRKKGRDAFVAGILNAGATAAAGGYKASQMGGGGGFYNTSTGSAGASTSRFRDGTTVNWG